MADNNVPNGVTLTPVAPQGNTATQNDQSGQGVPSGVTLTPITQNQNQNTAPSGHHFTIPNSAPEGVPTLGTYAQGGVQALTGAGEAAFKGVAGAADLVNKGLRKLGGPPTMSDLVSGKNTSAPQIPTDKLHELAGDKEPQTGAENIGYGGETLLEFIAGDAAIKGLPLAERLMTSAKTMKVLQNSPRLVQALAKGAAIMGVHGAEAGAVQGAQTLVSSGGDVKQAAKDAAIMGAIAGPLGLVGEGVSKVGQNIEKGVKAQEALDYTAGKAIPASTITGNISDAIDQSEANLHSNYENSINDFKSRLKGQELDPKNKSLPIAQKAKELLQKPVPPDHELVGDFKNLRGEKLNKQVRTILEKAAKGTSGTPLEPNKYYQGVRVGRDGAQESSGWWTDNPNEAILYANREGPGGKVLIADTKDFPENAFRRPGDESGEDILEPNDYKKLTGHVNTTEKVPFKTVDAAEFEKNLPKDLEPYNIDNLIELRQQARAAAADYNYGDINSRTLRAFRDSIDDTIGTLAAQGRDVNLPREYSALRADYASKINLYDDPLIKNMREGNYGDATKEILSGGNRVAPRLQKLDTILGQPVMDELRKNVFTTVLDRSLGPHGELNPARLLEQWGKIPDASKDVLFNQGVPSAVIQDLMKDAHTARNLQYLSRLGVIGPIVGSSPFVYHLGLLGSLMTLGEIGGAGYGAVKYGGVKQLIDYIADHPKMWKAWGVAGKALQSPTVGEAIQGAVGKSVINQKANKQAMQGAAGMAGQ